MKLIEKHCEPCKSDSPTLTEEMLNSFFNELDDAWAMFEEQKIQRHFIFKNFDQALAFTNQIGLLAKHENHHPDIFLTWGKLTVTLWTHNINKLSENDFILAAKIDQLITQ